MHRLPRHLRSNAVGYVALFVALGGTSYAAVSLPRNSVGTAQLKSSAVTSAKVRNGSLATIDLSRKAISDLRGRTGSPGAAGAQGPQGVKGDKGDKGDPGLTLTAWSTGSPAGALPSDGVVTDLAHSHGGYGSGVLTLPVQSRVYITGTVDLANHSTTGPSRAICTAQRSSDGDGALVFDVSPAVVADLHEADVPSTGDGYVYVPLAVTGSVLLDAGTYDIGIGCTTGASGTLLVNNATMNVVAVPASS